MSIEKDYTDEENDYIIIGKKGKINVELASCYETDIYSFKYLNDKPYDKDVHIIFGLDEELYKEIQELQKNGMPIYNMDSKESIDNYSDLDMEIFQMKLEIAVENRTVPFCKPMKIYSGNDLEDLYIYDSEEGTTCVKHTFEEAYSEEDDLYYVTKSKYEVLSYEQALSFLEDLGIKFEVPRKETMKFVESSNYKGITGMMNRLANKNRFKKMNKEER